MMQLDPAARLVPQPFANTNAEALAPVTTMLAIASVWFPLLVSVTCCDELTNPTVSLPKERLVADKVAMGANPVPLRAMLCGEPLTLSAMVTAAV
ncbi:MAG: hypothetical protein P4L40_04555, partial [Terracidiphilus sp.]|nr:hypothetical protein [Terracidiphilus sp.]